MSSFQQFVTLLHLLSLSQDFIKVEDTSIDQSSDKLSESARDRTRGANLKQSENFVKSIVATCFIVVGIVTYILSAQ